MSAENLPRLYGCFDWPRRDDARERVGDFGSCERVVERERYVRHELPRALSQRPPAIHLRASPWRPVSRLVQAVALTESLVTITRHMTRVLN